MVIGYRELLLAGDSSMRSGGLAPCWNGVHHRIHEDVDLRFLVRRFGFPQPNGFDAGVIHLEILHKITWTDSKQRKRGAAWKNSGVTAA